MPRACTRDGSIELTSYAAQKAISLLHVFILLSRNVKTGPCPAASWRGLFAFRCGGFAHGSNRRDQRSDIAAFRGCGSQVGQRQRVTAGQEKPTFS